MPSLSIKLEARSAVHHCFRAYQINMGADLFGAWLLWPCWQAVAQQDPLIATIEGAEAQVPACPRKRATAGSDRERATDDPIFPIETAVWPQGVRPLTAATRVRIPQGPQRNSIGDRSRLCACPSFGQYTALDIDRQRSTSPHGAIAVIGREPMVTITDGASDFRLIT